MSPVRSVPLVQPRPAFSMTAYELMDAVPCTYRQVDYWVRLGLIETVSGVASPGSGYSRRFDRQAVYLAKIVKCLSRFGFHGAPLSRAVQEIKNHSPAARLVYVKQDGSTDWSPGATAAIVMDLDQFRLKPGTPGADR